MPVKDVVASQDFNRRIQIQQAAKTDNGQGGFETTWETIYTCWANIQNFAHGKGLFRKFLFSQLYPQVTTTIQIRFQKSVFIGVVNGVANQTELRVLYPAHGVNHIYQIIGAENPEEANVSIWLMCQENQAQPIN